MALRECAKVEKLLYKQARYFSGLLKGDWNNDWQFLVSAKTAGTCMLTAWKFQYFSVASILREINFRDCRCSKTDILKISRALNFYFNVFLQFMRAKIYQKFKSRDSKTAKMADFKLLHFQKLISRKIRVTFPHCDSMAYIQSPISKTVIKVRNFDLSEFEG